MGGGGLERFHCIKGSRNNGCTMHTFSQLMPFLVFKFYFVSVEACDE